MVLRNAVVVRCPLHQGLTSRVDLTHCLSVNRGGGGPPRSIITCSRGARGEKKTGGEGERIKRDLQWARKWGRCGSRGSEVPPSEV
jgi:hypothetical protein